jgi:hypothetical protein
VGILAQGRCDPGISRSEQLIFYRLLSRRPFAGVRRGTTARSDPREAVALEASAELYTNGADEINRGGSIVGVDLFSLSPTERDTGNAPKKVLCLRLIFPVESFANSVEVMQTALKVLVHARAWCDATR